MTKKILLLISLLSTFTFAQRTAYTTFGNVALYDTGTVVIDAEGNYTSGLHIRGTNGGNIIQSLQSDANGSSSFINLYGTGDAYTYAVVAFVDSVANKFWTWGYRTGKTTASEKRRLHLEYFDGSAYNVAAYFDTTYSLIFPTGYVDADSFRLNGTTALTKATWHSGIGASSMGAVTLSSLTSQGAVSGTAFSGTTGNFSGNVSITAQLSPKYITTAVDLTGATAATARRGRISSMNYYTMADDDSISIWGSGTSSPGANFAGFVTVYANATNNVPIAGEEENIANVFIQAAAGASSNTFKTILAGANVEIISAPTGVKPTLANVTDGKLGIVIGGGSATVRSIFIFNRLGGTRTVQVQIRTLFDTN